MTLNRSFYETRGEDFRLWAVVHRSDGDDRFEPDEDSAIEVGGSPVMSRFGVERTDPIEPTASGTSTPAADTAMPNVRTVTTPTATRAVETIQVVTPSPTVTDTTTEGSVTSPGQPRFGPVLAVLAVVTTFLLATRRAKHR